MVDLNNNKPEKGTEILKIDQATHWIAEEKPQNSKNEVSSPYKQVSKKTIYEVYKKENFEDKNNQIRKISKNTLLYNSEEITLN